MYYEGKSFETLNVKFIFNRHKTDYNPGSFEIIIQKLLLGRICNFGLAYLKTIEIDFC